MKEERRKNNRREKSKRARKQATMEGEVLSSKYLSDQLQRYRLQWLVAAMRQRNQHPPVVHTRVQKGKEWNRMEQTVSTDIPYLQFILTLSHQAIQNHTTPHHTTKSHGCVL